MDSDLEFERRFNTLEREILDGRSKHIDWELARSGQNLRIVAIIIAAIGVVVTSLSIVLGIITFFNFKDLEIEARKSMERLENIASEANEISADMQGHAQDIREYAGAIEKIEKEAQEGLIKVQETVNKVQGLANTAEEKTSDDQVQQTDDESSSMIQEGTGFRPEDSGEEG